MVGVLVCSVTMYIDMQKFYSDYDILYSLESMQLTVSRLINVNNLTCSILLIYSILLTTVSVVCKLYTINVV